MNPKALIPLAAGLGIGGFALWMGFNTLQSARGAPQPVAAAEILAAKLDIPRGTAITEEMLQTMRFPEELLPEGAFKDQEALIGRVPRVDAVAGLPLLESMLLEPGAPAGLFVKAGFRAVAVQIDSGSGVDYHLVPGCFVDVVGSFPVRRDGRTETLAKTILENVEVAAVGQQVSAVRSTDEQGKTTGNRVVRAVTLFVKPEDVPKLLLAEQKGRIKLSRRSDDDTGRIASQDGLTDVELTGTVEPKDKPEGAGATGSLFDRLGGWLTKVEPMPQPVPVAVAVAPPPEPVSEVWEVAVIHGDAKETVRFRNRDSREPAEEEGGRPGRYQQPTARPAPVLPPAGPGVSANPGGSADQNENVDSEPEEPQE